MTEEEFNREFKKVVDETSDYWDSGLHKKLLEEHSDKNGKMDLPDLYKLLRDESSQYTNQLVYNALIHFLVDSHKD